MNIVLVGLPCFFSIVATHGLWTGVISFDEWLLIVGISVVGLFRELATRKEET